jgi:polysaccharide export outer membrane protein
MRIRKSHSAGFHPDIISITRTAALCLLLGSLVQSVEAQQPEAGPTTTSASMEASAALSSVSSVDSWYRIGPGDVLDVRVFNQALLSVTVRVNEHGMISLPLLGDKVAALCRTERELAGEIGTRYVQGKYLKNPQVDVMIKDYQASPVAVIGAVNGPGRFQLQRRVRLLELLMLAGGPAATAANTIEILHTAPAPACEEPFAGAAAGSIESNAAAERIENNLVSYRLSETMRGSEGANPYVRAGDIITLPASGQALILGNVAKPGPIVVNEQTTLSNAIAFSGGTLPDTRGEVLIRRQVPGSMDKTELVVNLTAIRKRQASDVMLQDGDIVEVAAASGFGSVLKGLMRTIVPTIGSLPVRVIRPY